MRRITPDELPAPREAKAALARFCREARALAPGGVERIVVYGSMARGDAGPESDLDIWVDWVGDEAHGRRVLMDLAGRVFAEDGVLVSVHVVGPEHRATLAEWDNAFYRAIQREGLTVDA